MRLVRDLVCARPTAPSAVTVGVFDGVHVGHQRIIGDMVAHAHAQAELAIVYTFDPHPAVAMDRQPPRLLTTLEERARLMAAMGVDILAVPPFTAATARTSAAEFIDRLVQRLRLAQLWAGPDFGLGHRREGDIEYVRKLGRERGFSVRVVAPVQCEGAPVSSSRIRAALADQDVALANACLGRPYRISGEFRTSAGKGWPDERLVGALCVPSRRLVPAAGAYACLGHDCRGDGLPCVTYVRVFDEAAGAQPGVEVHLLGPAGEPPPTELALDFVAALADGTHPDAPDGSAASLLGDARLACELLSDSVRGYCRPWISKE